MQLIKLLTNNFSESVILLSSSKDNSAFANFNNELNKAAGSCLVSAIRAQIENTLLQFEGINNVVISVEGKTEEILQP